MQNFSDRLALAIKRAEIPKGELAARCGVALSTVSRWLAGSVPKKDTLDQISECLGVDAKWLVYGGPDLASDATKIEDEHAQYMAGRSRAEPEPTMAQAFQKLGEALDMLKLLMERMPKDDGSNPPKR